MGKVMLGAFLCGIVWALTHFGAPWYVWVIALLVGCIVVLVWALGQMGPRWPGWE